MKEIKETQCENITAYSILVKSIFSFIKKTFLIIVVITQNHNFILQHCV